MHIQSCVALASVRLQNIFVPRKGDSLPVISAPHPSHFLLFQPLRTPCLLSVSMVLPVPCCHLHTDSVSSGSISVGRGLCKLFISKRCSSADKEATCRCRRPGFDPWVWKIPLEKEMATHSSILAWEIPWSEKPGGLQFMESQSDMT